MIIISGPSTVGKNPFIYKACDLYGLEFVVPYTTRKIRVEEQEGKDYWFLTKASFQENIQNMKISEWDYCLGNYYGYGFKFPGDKTQITHGLSRMALRIKKRYPNEITTIFLMPSDKNKIIHNIKEIYTGKDLIYREALAEEEIMHATLFDKVFIVSDSVYDLFSNPAMVNILESCEAM